MTTAILGAGRSSPSILAGAKNFSLRDDHSLAAFDVLIVDMDAVLDEFGVSQSAGDNSVLEAMDSRELLACARRWREHIRMFLGSERLCAVIWSRPPVCRIHTLQDIVEFSAADLLPDIAIRFDRLETPTPVHSVAGEPLSQFVDALGLPFDSQTRISLSPSQPIMMDSLGHVAACYAFVAPAHLVFAGIPSGQAARERMLSALHELGSTLGSASYSRALPAWAESVRLPGEDQAISQLQALEAQLQSLLRAREDQTARLASIRKLKSLLAGSPAQACLVFSDACRRKGITLMRDFPDDAAVVLDLQGLGQPALFVFDDDSAPGTTLDARCAAMLQAYRFETDVEALSCVIRIGTGSASGSDTDSVHLNVAAQQILDLLCDDACKLDPALSELLRKRYR